MAKIFQLKVPMLLDSPNGLGQLYFSPFSHYLDYQGFQPNGKEEKLDIQLIIVGADDPKRFHVLKTFNLTKEGVDYGPALNTTAIQTAKDRKEDLDALIAASKDKLDALNSQKSDLDALAASSEGKDLDAVLVDLRLKLIEIADEKAALSLLEKELAEHVIPAEVFTKAFKYSDVIDWFQKDGTILDQALPAVMMIPFQNRPIKDWVEIIDTND